MSGVIVTVPSDDDRYSGQPFVGTTFRGTLLYYIEEAEAWVIQSCNDPSVMDIFPRCFFRTHHGQEPPKVCASTKGVRGWKTYTIRPGVIDWQGNNLGGMQTPAYIMALLPERKALLRLVNYNGKCWWSGYSIE